MQATLHYFYPRYCVGCGNDPLPGNTRICSHCLQSLPHTRFFEREGNPVEKVFDGRLRISAAAALYYFTKRSLVQQLLVRLKYHRDQQAGLLLGRLMGHALQQSQRFDDIDLLIPIPLNKTREFKRGYNQATILCQGIVSVWYKPLLTHAVERRKHTDTQTQQNRLSRWQNMEGIFSIKDEKALSGKHILLVDDVITTGATIESCGNCLLQVPDTRLSVCSAAYTF